MVVVQEEWARARVGFIRGCTISRIACSHWRELHRTIRLPGDYSSVYSSSDSGVLATLASVPWFLIGLGGIAYEYVASRVDLLAMGYRSRSGYRDLPIDEDAQILRFEDEE